MPTADMPKSATGRANQNLWTALSTRTAYRVGVTAADTFATAILNDTTVPPIEMRNSPRAANGTIFAFVRPLAGMTAATVQLWVDALDVPGLKPVTPAATDWCLVEEVAATGKKVVRFDNLVAGKYKIIVSSVTGAGTLAIHIQHTNV